MTSKGDEHSVAVERLDAARDERNRRAEQRDDVSDASEELAASAELKAAEEQFAAREAWVEWVERDY